MLCSTGAGHTKPVAYRDAAPRKARFLQLRRGRLRPLDLFRRLVEGVDDRLDLLRGGGAAAQAKSGRGAQFIMARMTEPIPPRPDSLAIAKAGEDGVDLGFRVGELLSPSGVTA